MTSLESKESLRALGKEFSGSASGQSRKESQADLSKLRFRTGLSLFIVWGRVGFQS